MKTNKMNNKKFFNLKDYVEANYDKPLDKEALINYPLLKGAVSLVKSTIFDKEGMQNTDEFIIKEVAPGLTCCYCDIADASRKNPLIRVIVLPMGAEISDNTIFFLSDASERYILSNGLEYCIYVKDKMGISLCADINLQKCSVEDIEFMSKISTESFDSLVRGDECTAEACANIVGALTTEASFISDAFVDFLRESIKVASEGNCTVEVQLYREFLERLTMCSDSFVEFIQKKSGVNTSIENVRNVLTAFMDLKSESVSDEDSVSADELWDSSEYEDDDNLFTPDEDTEVDEDIDEETLEGILKFISEDEELNSLIKTIAGNEGVEVSEVINKVFKDKNVEEVDKITSLGDFWDDDEAEDNEDVIDDITSSDIFGITNAQSVSACSLDDIKKVAGCKATKMSTRKVDLEGLIKTWNDLSSKRQFAGVAVFGRYYQTYDMLGAVRAVMDNLIDVVGICEDYPDTAIRKLTKSVICYNQGSCPDNYICYRGKFVCGISDTNIDIMNYLFFMHKAARIFDRYVAIKGLDKSLGNVHLVFNKKASDNALSDKQKKNQEKGTVKVGNYYRVTNMKQKWVQGKTTGFTPCKLKIAVGGTVYGDYNVSNWGDLVNIAIKYAEEKLGGTEIFCKKMMGKSDLIHYTYDEFKKNPEQVLPTKNVSPVLYEGVNCNFYYNQHRKNTQVVSFLKKFEDAFGLKLSIRFKAK